MDAYGSLVACMDELVALEQTIAPDELTVSRWLPAAGAASLPGIWNHLVPSRVRESRSSTRVLDDLQINVRIGANAQLSDDQALRQLERYFDLARDTLDRAFLEPIHPGGPMLLDGIAYTAKRLGVQFTLVSFGSGDTTPSVPVFELPIQITLAHEYRRS